MNSLIQFKNLIHDRQTVWGCVIINTNKPKWCRCSLDALFHQTIKFFTSLTTFNLCIKFSFLCMFSKNKKRQFMHAILNL